MTQSPIVSQLMTHLGRLAAAHPAFSDRFALAQESLTALPDGGDHQAVSMTARAIRDAGWDVLGERSVTPFSAPDTFTCFKKNPDSAQGLFCALEELKRMTEASRYGREERARIYEARGDLVLFHPGLVNALPDLLKGACLFEEHPLNPHSVVSESYDDYGAARLFLGDLSPANAVRWAHIQAKRYAIVYGAK